MWALLATLVATTAAAAGKTIGSKIGFQIHSYNDLRLWPQVLRKGATYLKIDPNFQDAQFCSNQERVFNKSDTRGCFVLNHDDPSAQSQRLTYNTTNDLLAFISSDAYRSHFASSDRVYIALCWKGAPNPCIPTAHAKKWLSLVDSFFEDANAIVLAKQLNVEFVMDNSVVKSCTLQRWRPWVATSGPDAAFTNNATKTGDDRW
jgi:hypothetical protein